MKRVNDLPEGQDSSVGSTDRASRSAMPRASDREDRRWRRGWKIGLAVAVIAHLALFLFRSEVPPPEWAAAGPERERMISLRGGGAELEQIEVRVTAPEEEQREDPPEEIVPEPVPEPDIVDEPEVEPEDGARAGAPERGPPILGAPATGAGEGTDEGRDDGPGRDDAGDGGGGGPPSPSPRGMLLPPDGAPASVRGREIGVLVFVNTRGRVEADSTRLDPATPDRRYNQRLIQRASEWTFNPAMQNGQPVAAWYRYEAVF